MRVGQLSDVTREASDGVCEAPDAAMQFRVVTQPASGRAHVDGDRGKPNSGLSPIMGDRCRPP
jgi:hypothetical protein